MGLAYDPRYGRASLVSRKGPGPYDDEFVRLVVAAVAACGVLFGAIFVTSHQLVVLLGTFCVLGASSWLLILDSKRKNGFKASSGHVATYKLCLNIVLRLSVSSVIQLRRLRVAG